MRHRCSDSCQRDPASFKGGDTKHAPELKDLYLQQMSCPWMCLYRILSALSLFLSAQLVAMFTLFTSMTAHLCVCLLLSSLRIYVLGYFYNEVSVQSLY